MFQMMNAAWINTGVSGMTLASTAYQNALEYVKTLWHESVKVVRILEKEQEVQLQKVLLSQQELRSFETLEEKYQDQFKHLEKISEQKELDEIAVTMVKDTTK